jgi:Catalase
MNGYGSHTFKAVNAKNEAVYVKFHFKTDQVKIFFFPEPHHLDLAPGQDKKKLGCSSANVYSVAYVQYSKLQKLRHNLRIKFGSAL